MTRILVIEDDASLREWLKKVLDHRGYDVQLAENGDAGLQRLLEAQYDLLVLDLIMPQMSGFEVLTAMEAKGIRIPTVITSGIVIPGVHDYLKTHPQVQLLSKPYTEQQLENLIGPLLKDA
ncbi:MAG TPA: response regulator [Planctomycetota bacterium]|nr:response regulator [Planctomycetota bacterium]